MIFILFIIVIFVLAMNLRDALKDKEILLKKVAKLEKEISELKEEKVEKTEKMETAKIEPKVESKPVIQTPKAKKIKRKNDENVKNKYILMTGAILIVLAAIVFLTSTWYTIPNIVKTCVIVLLAGVFFGASNIAKNVFKLKDTSNTFFYIALAYLPLALFSISLFGFLGDYLSISGEGKYIYYVCSTIILAITYFIIGDKRNNKILFNCSMAMQLLFATFFALCISEKLSSVLLGILIYNIVLTIVKKNYLKKYKNIINVYNILYFYTIFISEIILLFNGSNIINVITNLLLIFNCYLYYRESKGYTNIITILIQFLVLSISILSSVRNVLSIETSELILFIVLITMYIEGIINENKKWKDSLILISNFGFIFLYISTFIIGNDILIIKNHVILWAIAVSQIINYMTLKDKRNLFINLIPIGVFLAQLNTVISNELNINYLIFMNIGLFFFSVSNLLKNKKHNLILQIYSNIILIITFAVAYDTINYNVFNHIWIIVLILISYCYAYLRNIKFEIYEIIAFVISNILIATILNKFELYDYIKYSFFITTIIITVLQYCSKQLQNLSTKVYLIVSFILSFITLNIDMNYLSFAAIVVLGGLFYCYVKEQKLHENFKIIPCIALLPSIYLYKWAIVEKVNLMIFVSYIFITVMAGLSIKKDKINIYTIMSAISIFLQAVTFRFNIYVDLIIAILCTIVHLAEMKKERIKFKVVLYVLCLTLYNVAIGDIIEKVIFMKYITAFNYLGYLAFGILIIRDIIKKYLKDEYKIFEYILCSFIYYFAIINYTSEFDGIIFVAILFVLTIISYIKKLGPLFFTTIIAIVINIFLLTREFWFNIPWWVYMLVIGTGLITFAVKNELSENKQREVLKKKFNDFKDYIDM